MGVIVQVFDKAQPNSVRVGNRALPNERPATGQARLMGYYNCSPPDGPERICEATECPCLGDDGTCLDGRTAEDCAKEWDERLEGEKDRRLDEAIDRYMMERGR